VDPDKCLQELLEAIERKDWTEVSDRARALEAWIDKGGFEPEVTFTLI
jgi:hypothetical protein